MDKARYAKIRTFLSYPDRSITRFIRNFMEKIDRQEMDGIIVYWIIFEYFPPGYHYYFPYLLRANHLLFAVMQNVNVFRPLISGHPRTYKIDVHAASHVSAPCGAATTHWTLHIYAVSPWIEPAGQTADYKPADSKVMA